MNNFKRYDVVTFEDGSKVVVLETLMHDGIEYLYVGEVTDDEEDLTDVYYVMNVDCTDATLQKETNQEVLAELLPKFQQMLLEDDEKDE